MSYRISIWTHIYRDDDLVRTWGDPLTLHGCSEALRTWIAGSCKTTSFWLIRLDDHASEDCRYTLRYRTIVQDEESNTTVSDTDWAEFWCLSGLDIWRFQIWAAWQWAQMMVRWLWG